MKIFKWEDAELQKWVKNATKMQDQHVIDNNNTKFFEYKKTELDAIQLRICMILFGMKVSWRLLNSRNQALLFFYLSVSTPSIAINLLILHNDKQLKIEIMTRMFHLIDK